MNFKALAARLSGSSGRMWLVFAVGIAGVVFGIWLAMATLPRWLHAPARAAGAAVPAAGDTRKIHATLFYVAENGAELVALSREVPLGATPAEQARRIVEAELQPAPAGLYSPIPAGTQVHHVYVTSKGEAFVDLSREIMTGHTGGSLDEALTVFALVNAVTVNLPDVSGVQILVDGKEVDTLAGHIDLRHPLGRSLKWVKRQ
jgi:spore germination protein GerM